MSMYSLLRTKKEAPTQQEIEESLAGNLCRCTGYRPILDAFRVFAKSEASMYTDEAITAAGGSPVKKIGANLENGTSICPSTGIPCDCGKSSSCQGSQNGFTKRSSSFQANKTIPQEPQNSDDRSVSLHKLGKDNVAVPRAEPIFPPELVKRATRPLFLRGTKGLKWYRPTTLLDLLDLKLKYPDAKLVGGNTEVGIETRFKALHYPVLIATTHVPELLTLKVRDFPRTLNTSLRADSVVFK